jgi:hypothetical protein
MVLWSQAVAYPSRELVRRCLFREQHEISTLGPYTSISTREIDTAQSRTPEPLLQRFQIMATGACQLRHFVEL